MELSNSIIFNEVFKEALSRLIKKELDSVTSLKLVKLVKDIQSQTKDVFEVRDSFLTRYADGTVFKSEENKLEFFKEMDNLLSINFETSLKEKIVIPKGINISADDVLILESIIDVDKSLENMEKN